MKKILVCLTFLVLSNTIKGQNHSNYSEIPLSVVMPDSIEGGDVSLLSKLESKIVQITAGSGLAVSSYNNNFVIYPVFFITETSTVESGMQDLLLVDCELTLFIKQVDNNIIFSTVSKQLKGIGKSKNLALSNAISKININDQDYKLFIEKGKIKIVNYYEVMCESIISKSKALVKMHDYEQALGLMMTIPEEVKCHNTALSESIEAYLAFQNYQCKIKIQNAKSQIALKNYVSALNILSQIDPSTSCFKESQSIVTDISSKIEVEDRKQWDLKMRVYQDAILLEKQRIDAIKSIASEYYKSRPNTVVYTYLIR